MSKGSPMVALRIEQRLLDRIDAVVERSQLAARDEPYTRTSWILSAVLEKIRHAEAAQRQRERQKEARTGRLKKLARLHSDSAGVVAVEERESAGS